MQQTKLNKRDEEQQQQQQQNTPKATKKTNWHGSGGGSGGGEKTKKKYSWKHFISNKWINMCENNMQFEHQQFTLTQAHKTHSKLFIGGK